MGWQGDGRALRPIVLRWRGSGWTRPAGLPGWAADAVLTDVRVGGDAASLLGYRTVGAQTRGFLWRVAGGQVSVDRGLSAVPGSMIPDALALDRTGEPLVAGAYRNPRRRGYAALLGSREGTSWNLARNPGATRSPSHLRAVAWARGRAWATGWSRHTGTLVSSCGTLQGAGTDRRPTSQAASDGRRRPTVRGAVADPGQPIGRERRVRAAQPIDARAVAGGRSIRFRDVAVRAGLSMRVQSYGGTALDIDGDGWQDLLISRHTESGRLLRNRRGVFRPAAGDPLPALDRHGCAAADVDGDGRDDAYCAAGAARGAKLKSNELWLGLGSDRPRDHASAFGVDEPLSRGRRAVFLDLNGDRWPDLFVTSDPNRVDGLPSLDRAFVALDGSGFRRAPELGLELPVGGACALSADLDADGRAEVIVCTEVAWGGGAGVRLFRREGGRFRDATERLGVRPAGDVDAAVGDLDGDGRADLVQLSTSRLTVSLQRGRRLQRVLSIPVVAGTAVAIGDADGDGDGDLYVVQGGRGNADDRLLLNRGSGRAFVGAVIPQARSGTADDVIVIDHDRNGTDDFLVLNGHDGPGPVQLIAGIRG